MNANIENNTNLISIAINVLQEQVPDISNQCINQGIASSVFSIICLLGCIIGCVFGLRYLQKTADALEQITLKTGRSYTESLENISFLYWVVCISLLIIFSIILLINLNSLISIIVAPKIYILKQLLNSFK